LSRCRPLRCFGPVRRRLFPSAGLRESGAARVALRRSMVQDRRTVERGLELFHLPAAAIKLQFMLPAELQAYLIRPGDDGYAPHISLGGRSHVNPARGLIDNARQVSCRVLQMMRLPHAAIWREQSGMDR